MSILNFKRALSTCIGATGIRLSNYSPGFRFPSRGSAGWSATREVRHRVNSPADNKLINHIKMISHQLYASPVKSTCNLHCVSLTHQFMQVVAKLCRETSPNITNIRSLLLLLLRLPRLLRLLRPLRLLRLLRPLRLLQ